MNGKWPFNKQTKRLTIVVVGLALSFIAGVVLWGVLAPVEKYSAVFWLGIILLGLPFYCAAEGLGSLGLDSHFVKSWQKYCVLFMA